MQISIYNVKNEPIGCGGMGEVYIGWDPKGNVVAIKKIRTELTTDANLRAFFHREVNTLQQLEHQSIVKMYATFEENGSLYLVMEYVEGESIEQYVKRKGTIQENEAICFLSDILPAVGYLHQKGFVHRDIKPGNIMIRPNGKLCLLDFGIVKDMNHSSGYTVNQIIGTDGYMSMEQAAGMSIDHRSDIYSLGCVLYYMLTGSHAIQKQSNDYATRMTIVKSAFPRAKDFNPEISDDIQRVLDKATDKNMLRRFQSCREFELELSGNATAIKGDYTDNRVSVGRENCDIIVLHPKVSRHHLDIIKEQAPEGNFYRLCDRSTNGTVVNGEKIQNSEKSWLNHYRHKDEFTILLAGEAELRWEEVEAAFTKKQNTTKQPAKDTQPPIPHKRHEGENATSYLIAIYILMALGGWLGIVLGISVYNSKIDLQDGTKVHRYKESHRRAALIGVILSGISVFLWIIIINS